MAWLTDVLERMVSGQTKATKFEQLLPRVWMERCDSQTTLAVLDGGRRRAGPARSVRPAQSFEGGEARLAGHIIDQPSCPRA
jgi:hypothetical protein